MSVPFVDMRRLLAPCREDLIAAFARVLDSGGLVQGAEVAAFEAEFAAQMGAAHAIAASNGTTALHLALAAAGVGPGDEVITVANTFIATAEAITMAGATPVFADIEEDGFNIDPADAARRITPRTRAIIAVHLYGQLADMGALRALCDAHGLALIEDACQAHGATLEGRAAGTLGDIGCLSFYPTKNLPTVGEGGMVLTADAAIAARARSLRDHGQEGKNVHAVPGHNYRLPEVQAAALRVLLPHLEAWNAARREAARWYCDGLAGLPLEVPAAGPAGSHVYHLYVVRSRERDALREHLAAAGVGTMVHYPTPIHHQPAYRADPPVSLPRTEAAVAEILSLPLHPAITSDEVAAVCAAVRRFYA